MRLALLAFLAFVVAAIAVACSSSFPRDQYYGTDAGTDFVPPKWDAPGTLPGDGGDDAMDIDAATD
jgi:hypothetical protein